MALFEELFIEFLFTFIISLIILKTNGQFIPVTVSFVVLAAIAYNISGGFFNPATTTLAFLAKRKTTSRWLLYIFVQMVAILSAYKYYNVYGIQLNIY